MKLLKFNGDECTGCLSCQLTCSFERLKVFNPTKASLRVKRNGLENPSMTYCRHCKKPLCIEACEFDAMKLVDGVVIIDDDKCTGCGLCSEKCPFDAIFLQNETAYKCNQCNGEFKCTSVCTTGAIAVIETNKGGGK